MNIIRAFSDFFGETEHFRRKNGALRWSILVGKQKHNIQKPREERLRNKVSWLPRLLRAIFRLVGVWSRASVPGSQSASYCFETRVSQLSELMFISFTTTVVI